jgi:hypothetical protein
MLAIVNLSPRLIVRRKTRPSRSLNIRCNFSKVNALAGRPPTSVIMSPLRSPGSDAGELSNTSRIFRILKFCPSLISNMPLISKIGRLVEMHVFLKYGCCPSSVLILSSQPRHSCARKNKRWPDAENKSSTRLPTPSNNYADCVTRRFNAFSAGLKEPVG